MCSALSMGYQRTVKLTFCKKKKNSFVGLLQKITIIFHIMRAYAKKVFQQRVLVVPQPPVRGLGDFDFVVCIT